MITEGAYKHRWIISVNTTNNNIRSFWQNNFNNIDSRWSDLWILRSFLGWYECFLLIHKIVPPALRFCDLIYYKWERHDHRNPTKKHHLKLQNLTNKQTNNVYIYIYIYYIYIYQVWRVNNNTH